MSVIAISSRQLHYIIVVPCANSWDGDIYATARPVFEGSLVVAYRDGDGAIRTKPLHPDTRLYQWDNGYTWTPPEDSGLSGDTPYLSDAKMVMDVSLPVSTKIVEGQKTIYITLPFGRDFVRGQREHIAPASPRRYILSIGSVVDGEKTEKREFVVAIQYNSASFDKTGFEPCVVYATTVLP